MNTAETGAEVAVSVRVRPRTRTTLVAGAKAADRENAICTAIEAAQENDSLIAVNLAGAVHARTAIILEGLSDGVDRFPAAEGAIKAVRIAPACPCCTGNLTMRVTLNRVLRHPPRQLFISLANSEHLAHFREFLASAPYDQHIDLTADLLLA